jgi:hypothetical protein
MINLAQAEKFFASFTVRNRQTNRPIPFRLNPSQQKIMEACKQHVAKRRRLFVIFLKGRRLGVSTWARMLAQAHLLEKDYSEGLILAQQKITARALYEESHLLAKQLPLKKTSWKYTQQEINFFKTQSKISWQTANNVVGSRGLGFTFLHMSEAAYYQNPEVFTAVSSTLSDDPENMGIVETTPNGKEGPGQAYYQLWDASERGDTEYLAQFLPWHDDPDYVRDPAGAKDAPRNDYEKFLMRELKLPKERIAFFRYVLHSRLGGNLDKWRKEYPGNPEEAFEVSGDPVFSFDDLSWSRKCADDVACRQVELEIGDSAERRVRAQDHRNGRFILFERPDKKAHYFAGVMIGHGDRQDTDSTNWDDTLAMVVWNGETGALAARAHMCLSQETASASVYALAAYFNMAKVACEDGGGGFGSRIFQELRDRWRYPNQYRWKGRNDQVNAAKSSNSLGFTIQDYTRRMMLNAFLTALRRREAIPLDAAFTEQMSSAQWEGDFRFEAVAGFDEILFAGLLGWIAKDQWHPLKCESYASSYDDGLYEDALSKIAHQKSPFDTSSGILTMNLQAHLDKLKRWEKDYVQIR